MAKARMCWVTRAMRMLYSERARKAFGVAFTASLSGHSKTLYLSCSSMSSTYLRHNLQPRASVLPSPTPR